MPGPISPPMLTRQLPPMLTRQQSILERGITHLHDQEIPDEPNCWDKLEGYWDYASEKVKIKWLTESVLGLLDKLPEPFRTILREAWKVSVIVAVLFIVPQSIVCAIFAVCTVVTILRPVTFFEHHRIGKSCTRAMGFYAGVHAIIDAASVSFSPTPHLAIIATAIHLVVCYLCFDFAMHISDAAKEKDEKVKAHRNRLSSLDLLKGVPRDDEDGGKTSVPPSNSTEKLYGDGQQPADA